MKCKIYLKKCFALVAMLLFTSVAAMAQNRTVTGTVTDVSGQPIIGASVTVQGTTIGVSTDATGSYSIRVPSPESVLSFDFLGYESQQITVGSQTTINVVMAENAEMLEDVVVIGYGTVRKRDVTGSVASIGGDDIAAMPVANAAQALQGRLAGVNITSTDGRPDADIKIRVRGGGSITQSNDPLFIVDGFPVSNINDIPASQIESIDVLKDASSTAIYGARGANGVVIVTTKSPKGEKLSITYDGYVQLKTRTETVDLLDPFNFTLINWEYSSLANKNLGLEQAMAIGGYANQYNNPNGGIYTYQNIDGIDWMDRLTRTAFAHSHNLAINGGNEKTKYSLAYNYVDDEGTKIESWYKRTNITAKIQQVITDGLQFDVDARYTRSSNYGRNDGSRLSDILKFSPVVPLGETNESVNTNLGLDGNNLIWRKNPEDVIRDIYRRRNFNAIRANAALSWEIIDGLSFRTEFGANSYWRDDFDFTGSVAKDTPTLGGDATIKKTNGTSYRFTNTLSWDVQGLGENHRLNILAGQEITGSDSEYIQVTGKDFPVSFDYKRAFAMMSQYSSGTTPTPSESGMSDPSRMASFFGRANYVFKDRYLFTATFRADGSSNFAKDNRWGYFPAAAFAWRMSEESFMRNITWMDNLKLRLSYGEAGNDRIDSGLWQFMWSSKSGGYSSHNETQNYYAPSSDMMINPNLKWETTITRNIGIDFGFFNNRLYGTIDGYWNTTKDLLLVNSLPQFTGFSSQMANVGQTRNIGLEFTVGGDIVRKKDLRVSANFNISFNRNKIEELSDGMDYKHYSSGIGTSSAAPVNDYEFRVGEKVGMIRGYVYDGFYTTDDFNYSNGIYTLKDGVPNSMPILSVVPGMIGVYPGMMKLKKMGTTNNATQINEADDAVIIGDTNPIHVGGFNLNASYKNFDLLMAFNWSYGNDIYNYSRALLSTGGKDYNRNFMGQFKDRYRLFDLNASGDLSRVTDPTQLAALNANAKTYYPFHEFRVLTSEFIEDGSFLRLNNITLGYTLPQHLTQKIAISRLRVYATVYNVWTWTNYTGLDPEVDSGAGRNSTYPTPGMDYGSYPRARTFTFGVNLSF